MQPYFLPYMGYWQLIKSVDKFIIFDDVNYIKRGWIHRNFVSTNGQKQQINLCIEKASINRKIDEHRLSNEPKWRDRLYSQIRHSSTRKDLFVEYQELIESIVFHKTYNLNDYLHYSISRICQLLEIKTQILPSTSAYQNDNLRGQERILDICRKENASEYVNLPGGRSFYDSESFARESIKLSFVKTKEGLSIIDDLLNKEKNQVIIELNSITIDHDRIK
ncbi:MAG: WbqC family protein [Verrucomicrobiota bacterium]|nr:WbqC family protein [Verrucomicrobiota bacterium]